MKSVFKFATIFTLIFLFLLVSAVLRLFIRDHFRLQNRRTRVQTVFCRMGLWILNVKVHAESFKDHKDGARLMVGNHLSYLDILVLSSIYSSSYVTSQEIRETPFLGMLCEWAGCLFVERRSRQNLSKEVEEIKTALDQGLSVTVFPEATSTNGEDVLRFRSPLYQAAIDSGALVQPFCLNYLKINNTSFSKGNRDFVCWYGDMDFLPHLWALCQLSCIDVNVKFLETIDPKLFQHPKELAAFSHEAVKRHFLPAS